MIHPGLLKRFRLLDDLEDEDLEAIASMLQIIEKGRKEVIFEEGSANQGVYLLVSGSVEFGAKLPSGREAVMAIYGPGDSFGEIAIANDTYPWCAVALEETILYLMPRKDLLALMRRRPRIALAYFMNLKHSFRKLRFALLNVRLKDSVEKLATYLTTLTEWPPRKPGTTLVLPAPKSVVAAYLNMTPPTFSRTLQALRKAGAIQVRARKIVIKDATALGRKAVRI